MRHVFRLLAVFCLVALALAAAAMIERDPLVARMAPPSSQDVATTRALVHRLRGLSNNMQEKPGTLQIKLSTINSALRMGARMVPGFRGAARVEPEGLALRGSLPILEKRFWINVTAVVPSYREEMKLAEFRIGRLPLPPGLGLWLLRQSADRTMGEGASERIISSLPAFDVAPDRVVASVDLNRDGRGEIAARAFSSLRGAEMPTAEEIATEYRAIRQAIDSGELPDHGSFLPHLRFALARAAAEPDADKRANAYTAAMFGLADACGARDFSMIAGRLIESWREEGQQWKTSCRDVTLAGRIDSRRHFITSVALQAASNRGVAVSIGEFKELFDFANGGFDFTDLAADLSGVRLSDRMMQTPAEMPALVARIDSEADVIISYEGLPGKIPGPKFKARYGDVDSPAYRAEVDRIETRIDALPLYQPAPS